MLISYGATTTITQIPDLLKTELEYDSCGDPAFGFLWKPCRVGKELLCATLKIFYYRE